MFTQLCGSTPARERSSAARALTLVAHAAVIAAAVGATMGSGVVGPMPRSAGISLVYVAPARPAASAGRHTVVPPSACDDPVQCYSPVIDSAPRIPDAPAPSAPETGGESVIPVAPPGPIDGPTPSVPADGRGYVTSADEPAIALRGNPKPVYPSLLRATRVEGVVIARFIVDTAGRVEPASIAFENEGDRLLEEAVRRALLGSRYRPAAVGGRRVRILVREDFVFRITP